MRLRFLSIAGPLALVLCVGALGIVLWRVSSSFGELERALEQRNAGFSVAAELARLSQPMPAASRNAAATPEKLLEDRFRATGAPEEEMKTLRQAIEAHTELHRLAAAAAQGLFDPVQGEIATGGTQPERMPQTLYGGAYEKLQTKLASNVDRLIGITDARTGDAVRTARNRLWREIALAAGLMIVFMLLAFAAGWLANRIVLRPIRRIAEGASRIAERNYGARVDSRKGLTELRDIAGAFNHMAQAVEDDTRSRMEMALDLQRARAPAETSPHVPDAPLARAVEPKRETDAIDSKSAAFDLQDVLSESLSIARSEARGKPLELSLELDPELAREPPVIGNAVGLRQVLDHLLANAITFTVRGSVRVSAFVLESDEHELVLCFTVTDTGCGMTEAQTERLVDESAGAQSRADPRRAGDGRGLAAIKRLVESMGGDIDVESELGKGSCFHFTIRVGKAKEPAKVVDIAATRTRSSDGAERKRTRGNQDA
ncbi:MAG: ATP-binding protein [Burkholderiales bacterium]